MAVQDAAVSSSPLVNRKGRALGARREPSPAVTCVGARETAAGWCPGCGGSRVLPLPCAEDPGNGRDSTSSIAVHYWLAAPDPPGDLGKCLLSRIPPVPPVEDDPCPGGRPSSPTTPGCRGCPGRGARQPPGRVERYLRCRRRGCAGSPHPLPLR